MARGKIRRLIRDRGFGFIKTAEGKDFFFHKNKLKGIDYNSLREGQEVEFEVGQGSSGRTQAVNVTIPGIRDKILPKTAVTTQFRLSAGLIAGILVALFFGIALYLRIALPYDKVFVGDWIKLTGRDAYYFMRHVDSLIHNFPHALTFDPYYIYPGGLSISSQSFFVYLWSGITWLVGFGSPTQRTIDTIGVYLPAIFGSLCIIPVYFIGKELFNRWAGVLAAGLLAIAPGEFLSRSILGWADRDGLEVLLTVSTMLFLILTIKSTRGKILNFNTISTDRTIIKAVIYSLVTGIFLGLYLLTWIGAFIFVFIIFIYLVIQVIVDHLRHKNINYLCLVGTITFLIALLIFLPSHPYQAYLAALVIAVITPPILAVLSWLISKTKIKAGYYPLALLGLSLIGLALIYAVNPSILESIFSQLGVLSPSQNQTVSEMQPIFFPNGTFSFYRVWGNFTTGFFLSLISLCILLYFLIKHGDADKMLMLVWTLVVMSGTLAATRLALFFSVNVAILGGYLAWLLLNAAGLKDKPDIAAETSEEAITDKKKKRKNQLASWQRLKPLSVSLAAIAVFFLFFFPNLAPARDVANNPIWAPSDAWCESLTWMKDNTPDPFGNPDFYYVHYESPIPGGKFNYPETAYGVTAWWDYGYWITRIGRRIPTSNPGATAGREQSFFTAQDETTANKVLDNWGSKYVIIDHDIATAYWGKFNSLAILSGKTLDDFCGIYYQVKDNDLQPVLLFYPEYYRSLVIRLYNFDGKDIIEDGPVVISYQEKATPDGKQYRQITSIQSFGSYTEAQNYISSQKSNNYRIVSDNPYTSPISIPAVEHYKLIYSSKRCILGQGTEIVPEVKIFEYTGP